MIDQSEPGCNRTGTVPGHPLLLLCLLALLLHAPGLFVPGYMGEEGRRVLLARGMLQDGNWLVPHLAGEPYLTKPPLYPWLIALLGALHGSIVPWLARLPAFTATLGTALLLLGLGRRLDHPRAGWLAALGWMLVPAAAEKAVLAETDQVLVFAVLLSSAGLLGALPGNGRRITLAAVGLALGLLVKGPPALIFFLALWAALAWRGEERLLSARATLLALTLGLLPLLAWSLAVLSFQEGAGQGWLRELSGAGDFSWGAYLQARGRLVLGIALAGFPLTLLLPSLLRERSTLLLAAALAFLCYLFSPRALPRYLYPALPWLALAAGRHLARRGGLTPLLRAGMVLVAALVLTRLSLEWIHPGYRVQRPVSAARIEGHLGEGEALFFDAPAFTTLGYLRQPLKRVRSPQEVEPGGLLLTLPPPPPGWTLLERFVKQRDGLEAVLVRRPPGD